MDSSVDRAQKHPQIQNKRYSDDSIFLSLPNLHMSNLLVLRLESLEYRSIQQVQSLTTWCHPFTVEFSYHHHLVVDY